MQFDPTKADPEQVKGRFVASLDVTEKISKSGKEMFEVKATINVNGTDRKSWDYLGAWNLWKLKELAWATGLTDRFAQGELHDVDLNGQIVGVEVGPDKQDPTRIAILHYLSAEDARSEDGLGEPVGAAAGGANDDEDVPF